LATLGSRFTLSLTQDRGPEVAARNPREAYVLIDQHQSPAHRPDSCSVAEAGTEPSPLLFGLVALKEKPAPET
jgi:hypothetical protein